MWTVAACAAPAPLMARASAAAAAQMGSRGSAAGAEKCMSLDLSLVRRETVRQAGGRSLHGPPPCTGVLLLRKGGYPYLHGPHRSGYWWGAELSPGTERPQADPDRKSVG